MKLLRIGLIGLLCITQGLILTACLKTEQEPTVTPLLSSPLISEATAALPVETQLPFTQVIPLQATSIRPTLIETLLIPSLTPTIVNARKPTPTQFIDTYPHKDVWISYEYASGDHYEYEMFLGIRNFPKLVLYTDGQLILNNNKLPIQTKMLSPDEICNLFKALESIGISKIQTNGTGDLDDPIYQNTKGLKRAYDAGTTILYINGSVPMRFAVYDPYKDHAVKPIMEIFNFLDHYTLNSLQPYHSDRLFVYVQGNRDIYLQAHPDLKDLTPIPWPTDATSLSQHNEGVLYLEGDAASKVFDLTGSSPMENGGLFVDKGVEYTVYVKPILPDEWRGSYCYNSPCHKATPFIPLFSCK